MRTSQVTGDAIGLQGETASIHSAKPAPSKQTNSGRVPDNTGLISPNYQGPSEDGSEVVQTQCAVQDNMSMDEEGLQSLLFPFGVDDATAEVMQFLDLPDVYLGSTMSFLDVQGVVEDISVSHTTPETITQVALIDDQSSDDDIADNSQFPSSPSISSEEYTVSISKQDHRLIQHFLNSMKQYSTKLRETLDEDLNCEMFSNMGLFNAQAFHAIMAFAARHLSQTQPGLLDEAELRYQRATALLLQDEDPYSHLDISIVTVWFLLQYELLFANGVIRFCNLLAHLAHVLESYDSRRPSGLTMLGARTLVWLSCYDARALASGGRAGYLLKSLENFLVLRPFLKEPMSPVNGGLIPLSDVFPVTCRLDHTNTLRLRFRNNLLHGRILMLLPNPEDGFDSSNVDDADWHSICLELLEMHDIFDRCTDELTGFPIKIATGKMTLPGGTLSCLRFGHLLALSSLYAAFIDYHQALRAAKRNNMDIRAECSDAACRCHMFGFLSSSECSARMMRIAHCVATHRRKSPQSMWPSLLFAAGIESEDGIHIEWILNSLKGTEAWAPHFLQTRRLLEVVLDYQGKSGKIVQADILRLQAETTGPFVI